MIRTPLVLAATLLASTTLMPITVFAQNTTTAPSRTTPGSTAPGATSNAPMPGVNPNTGTTPGTGMMDRNSGTAAASGDRNQAVTTTGANAPQPARGSNSFTQGEARRRMERSGFQSVGALTKDSGGVWRGSATKDGQPVQVWLDYKGNVGQGGMATNMNAPGSTTGMGTSGMGTGGRNLDGTTGNPQGTSAGRAMDRTLGTNTTGTNPTANMPDGTPGNPAGTAAGRAMDRTLGTNTTGANPTGTKQ